MPIAIETAAGRVAGTEEDGLRVFRGIPYARPPVGALRLRPPQAPEPWAGVRDASRPGPAAPQNAGLVSSMLGASSGEQSEDCLTLNVWAPPPGDRPRPVLVWIHGGGFTTGSGAVGVYDGARLARRGEVVVVTVNYRLGALGYLALPALEREEGGAFGNFGVLDQIAALTWVREHAAVFGGDPERITIFGESAGAMSIGALLGAPAAKGLFAGAILQSGAAQNVHDRESGLRVSELFAVELGVSPDDTAALRGAAVPAILAAQARALDAAGRGFGHLPFQPVVDGAAIPRSPLAAVRDGEAPAVPLLVGTNLEEYKLWGLADRKLAALDDAALLRRCARNVPGEGPDGRAHAERAVEVYRAARAERGESTSPQELWLAIETDRWFRHPAMDLAAAHARHQPRTFAYLFTWPSPALEGRLGSCHALEIPFVFGSAGEPAVAAFVGDDPAAAPLSDRMQAAWIAFARGGDPAGPDLHDWPAYEGGRRATRILGAACAVEDAPRETERAFWDTLR